MKSYQRLDIWNQGIQIVKLTYNLAGMLPTDERFGLVSQMTRAAVSIPANIAEGSSRNSDKDKARFLQISLGSAFELETYLVLIKEMKLVAVDFSQLEDLLKTEMRMIQSFIRRLNKGDAV